MPSPRWEMPSSDDWLRQTANDARDAMASLRRIRNRESHYAPLVDGDAGDDALNSGSRFVVYKRYVKDEDGTFMKVRMMKQAIDIKFGSFGYWAFVGDVPQKEIA